jgi:RNA polymerase sigma-70 factor (ECF subfamily)
MNARTGVGDSTGELSLPLPSSAAHRETPTTFDAIFVEHYPRVVDIIARVVADRSRAEQLAADVFWKLYRKSFFRPRDGNMAAWLHRVAVRVGLDALRTASRRNRHEAAAASEQARQSATPDPLAGVLIAERRAQVRATLATLKRRQARLLLLRASGLSYQEIAAALKVNPRSVGTLLARAEEAFEREHCRLHGSRD